MVFDGHCLSGKSSGLKALYFFDGSLSLGVRLLEHYIHTTRRMGHVLTWAYWNAGSEISWE
jgi:hypothetical protein